MPEPQNALTPEEWKVALNGAVRFSGDRQMFVLDDAVSVNLGRQYDEIFEGRERHRLAALCLYGQPFGFTHEDVKALLEDATEWDDRSSIFAPRSARLRSLAQRIASFLPPQP